MAQEISLTAGLSARVTPYAAGVRAQVVGQSLTDLKFNMATLRYSQGVISVDFIATTPIPLAQVSQPHWAYFRNRDTTNYILIRNGSTGADLIQLYPGEPAFVPLCVTSAPCALANAAACDLEYLILSL